MLKQLIENQIFHKAAPQSIRYIRKPDLATDDPFSKKILDQVAREFQLVPPITLHLGDPELMAGVWGISRESFIVNSTDRMRREAIAAAISILNQCPYCVTVHQSMLSKDNIEGEYHAEQLWASATLSPRDELIKNPPIEAKDIPQIMGTALTYHYINRVVSVFLGESPVALPFTTTTLGQMVVRAMFAALGKRITQLDPKPGEFIWEVKAKLPDEFSWAKPNIPIAKAFAQFAWAAEKAGNEAVHEEVRTVVVDHLSNWFGEQVPMSRLWLDETVSQLTPELQPAARLALLTARSAWQVDKAVIDEYRKVQSSEKKLLQTVAWASYTATRRISSWLIPAA